MSKDSKQRGREAEDEAARYLRARGYTILERNYRHGKGEIDLICKDENTVVFVEVKYRTKSSFGSPEEAVDWRKQRQLVKLARIYLSSRGLYDSIDCRFDVVSVKGSTEHTVEHIIDAFRPPHRRYIP
jgi:putative endonuclease